MPFVENNRDRGRESGWCHSVEVEAQLTRHDAHRVPKRIEIFGIRGSRTVSLASTKSWTGKHWDCREVGDSREEAHVASMFSVARPNACVVIPEVTRANVEEVDARLRVRLAHFLRIQTAPHVFLNRAGTIPHPASRGSTEGVIYEL